MRIRIPLALFCALLAPAALAQSTVRVTTCGAFTAPPNAGPLYTDANGNLCIAAIAGARTLVPLDVSTVTTGGTAVTALTAGHRTAGGWLMNPSTATINLCLNEIGTAAGTTSQGSLTCIVPGQTYTLAPAAGAVSVVSSDSAHPFSGFGIQ